MRNIPFIYSLIITIFLEIDGNAIVQWISQRRDLFSILSSNNRSPFLTIILSQSDVSDSQINYNQILPSSFFPSSYLYVFFILLSI